ncbi:hypothetical protein ACUN0C_15220 [Faunimonas sp. B44]|uniref:hypothetical protein n=1 Tax=Faunimonas sp. B44 TaxID=3461493 RepID=UPI0040450652
MSAAILPFTPLDPGILVYADHGHWHVDHESASGDSWWRVGTFATLAEAAAAASAATDELRRVRSISREGR